MSIENDKIIFNLFLMAFGNYQMLEFINERDYEEIIKYSNTFRATRDAFPLNEVCSYDIFHKNLKMYYKTINYIAESE